MVRSSADLIGINHYTSYYAKDSSGPRASTTTEKSRRCFPTAHSNWLYSVAWGVYKAMTYIKEHYGNPYENYVDCSLFTAGMDDAGNLTRSESLHDQTRINYYRSYLHNLLAAIRFEWLSSYTSRVGSVYVDFKHKDLKRTPKASTHFLVQTVPCKDLKNMLAS